MNFREQDKRFYGLALACVCLIALTAYTARQDARIDSLAEHTLAQEEDLQELRAWRDQWTSECLENETFVSRTWDPEHGDPDEKINEICQDACSATLEDDYPDCWWACQHDNEDLRATIRRTTPYTEENITVCTAWHLVMRTTEG